MREHIYSQEAGVVLHAYANKLSRAGITSALSDAVALISHHLRITADELHKAIAMQISVQELWLKYLPTTDSSGGPNGYVEIDGAPVDTRVIESIKQLDKLVDQRYKHKPLQYIIGVAPFRNLELEVGVGVFIPRFETEALVDLLPTASTYLDLCSGSGALALALATERARVTVYAVEKSAAAYAYLVRNAEKYADEIAAQNSTLIPLQADALKVKLPERVDVIVSNPPYIPDTMKLKLAPEVQKEPNLALFGGSSGFEFSAQLIQHCKQLLGQGGTLAIEHFETHNQIAAELLAKNDFSGIEHHCDLNNQPRFTTGQFK
jgi:release factor glutamine methyltransferase